MSFVVAWHETADAGEGDAVIQYNLGLSARAGGDDEAAYDLFKNACMASDGVPDACLAWADMAEASDNEKHVKRALSSAVVLAPENVRARYRLALYLLKKGDFAWAGENLKVALDSATREVNRPVLRYYLAYAHYKLGDLDEAEALFERAVSSPLLPPVLAQRCRFYLGLIARERGERPVAAVSMGLAQEGPDDAWTEAATRGLAAISAFLFASGSHGRLTAGTGFNSHPSTVFLDETSGGSRWVNQILLRGDAMWLAGTPKHRFKGSLTGLREQVWTALESAPPSTSREPSSRSFAPGDMNLTLFLMQLAYLRNLWLGSVEHLLLIGADGETQLMDRMPEKSEDGDYVPGRFGLYSWAVAAKAWWSFSATKEALNEVRFKTELRPNRLTPDRSTVRYRLRFAHTHHFLNRSFRLVSLVGVRYDRSYRDPAVIKYDRLIPEGEATVDWRLPVWKLAAEVGATLKYNWYLNSKYDEANSFRVPWQDDVMATPAENREAEEAYYDALTRRDWEWELYTELSRQVLPYAALALTYRYHSRSSNIDGDTPPDHFIGEPRTFGYRQHIIALELRSDF